MLIDGRTLEPGATLNADVCIVGAGPAGLILADALLGARRSVVVVEAGGQDTTDSTDALELEPSDAPLEPSSDSRWRQLGGTSAVWNARLRNQSAGRYIRLSRDDFERRSWLPHSGWPFGIEAVAGYYDRAERLVLQGIDCTTTELPEYWDLDPGVFATTREPFGFATTFTEVLPRRVSANDAATVVTNSMVTSINATATRTAVEHVTARAGTTTFTVRSSLLVLAAGGIENPRLLLLTETDGHGALGNGHDLVGRFFMDHPRVQIGRLTPYRTDIFDHSSAYDIRSWNGRYLGGKLALTEEYRGEQHLLNGAAHVIPHPNARNGNALEAVKQMVGDLRRREVGRATAAHLRDVLAGAPYVVGTGVQLAVRQRAIPPVTADGGWSHLRRNRRRFESFEVVYQCEQAPDPNNRVVLGTSRDEFELPRAKVESRWTPIDLETIEWVTVVLAEELHRGGIGHLERSTPPGVAPSLYQVGGAHHHLGTTRMHDSALEGVVDSNCRVHGIDNLYVAGTSVFPTGGYANPTLTMVALSLRLADHLDAPRS